MARPAYEHVGKALRAVYGAAGLRQEDVARALDVDQATVSKWSRGVQRIDLDYFPEIDRLCGRPLGHLLRLAGYVTDEIDVAAAIMADPYLDERRRLSLLDVYDSLRSRSAASATVSETPASTPTKRSKRASR